MERHSKSSLGRRYFSRALLRSYHFWVSTLFLMLVASEAVFFTVRFRSHLDSEARLLMMLPVVVMTVLWFKLLRSHQSVHAAYGDDLAAHMDQDPTVENILENLAYLSYAGFALASLQPPHSC
jgi:hypothetical protein